MSGGPGAAGGGGNGAGRPGGHQPRGPAAPNSGSGLAAPGAAGAADAASAAGGACPMRRWLGPLAGAVFDRYGKLHCPEPIVAARAALARTAPVRQLRPQALPLKLLAVAATAAAVNLPCGAAREHFEKFSVGWFVAVHATIPFVAMLRKAVVMPKHAILVTVAAAVVGQMVGARLERARLEAVAAAAAAEPGRQRAEPRRPACAAAGAPGRRQQRSAAAAKPAPLDTGGLGAQLSCALASITQSACAPAGRAPPPVQV